MRLSNDQVLAIITQAITNAGGEISHDDLMAAFDAQGAGAYAHMVIAFSQPNGPIKAHVKAQIDGSAPKLSYKVASATQPA